MTPCSHLETLFFNLFCRSIGVLQRNESDTADSGTGCCDNIRHCASHTATVVSHVYSLVAEVKALVTDVSVFSPRSYAQAITLKRQPHGWTARSTVFINLDNAFGITRGFHFAPGDKPKAQESESNTPKNVSIQPSEACSSCNNT